MASNYTRTQQQPNVIQKAGENGDVTITIRSNQNNMNWGDIETRDTESIRSYTPSMSRRNPRVYNFYDYLDYVKKGRQPPPRNDSVVYRAVPRQSAPVPMPMPVPYPVPTPVTIPQPVPVPNPYMAPPPPPILPPPQIYALPPPPPPQNQQQESPRTERKIVKGKPNNKAIVVDSDSEVVVLPKQKSPRKKEPQPAYYVTEVDDEVYDDSTRGERVVYATRSPRRDVVYVNKPVKPSKSQVIYLEDKPTRQIQLQPRQKRSSPVRYAYPANDNEFYLMD